jgi:hypothetical protein
MFVLIAVKGSYDDREEWVVAASRDEAKLTQHAADLQAARATEEEFQMRLRQLFVDTEKANPKRDAQLKAYDKPKWPPGLGVNQITQAMRDERQAWEDHQQAIFAEYTEINFDWQEQVWYPVYREFMKAEGREIPEGKLVFSDTIGEAYFEEIMYHTEEVPELV